MCMSSGENEENCKHIAVGSTANPKGSEQLCIPQDPCELDTWEVPMGNIKGRSTPYSSC